MAAPPEGLTPVALGVVLVGAFLAIVDFFIVNVALPSMGTGLHASSSALELVVAGYGVTYALVLVTGGRLGDMYGRRRLFVVGLGAFTVTSLLCGLAPTEETLVAFRVLQGASAAVMVPQVLATIQATTTGAQRARALSTFGAVAGLAAAVGQVVGGLLVSADVAGSSWRPIFLVNVPFGLLGMVLARRAIPETRAPRAAAPDLRGTLFLSLVTSYDTHTALTVVLLIDVGIAVVVTLLSRRLPDPRG
ncbi:MAG TPA: MFS transporter [Pseudonocardiaceae bacterium]